MNKYDEIFINLLIKESKLESNEVLNAIKIDEGFITEIKLSTSFRKIKNFPDVSNLIKLNSLILCEDTFAKSKRWLLKRLNIKSNSILFLKIEVFRLKDLTLDIPNNLNLQIDVDYLKDLEVKSKMNNLRCLIISGSTFPFKSWLHKPEKIEALKVNIKPEHLREGDKFNLNELPLISDYIKVYKFIVKASAVNINLEIDLDNHKKMEYLCLYSDGIVSIRGKMTSSLDLDIYYSTADPETLHLIADSYNWDNGTFDLEKIINSGKCSEDTAKLIYWRAKPTWYLQYESDNEVSNEEELKLIRLIESLFLEENKFIKSPIKWSEDLDPYPELNKLRSIPDYMYP